MTNNRESHAYDWRKGGEQSAPAKKARKPESTKTAKSAGELTAAKRKAQATSTFGVPAARKKKIDAKADGIVGE